MCESLYVIGVEYILPTPPTPIYLIGKGYVKTSISDRVDTKIVTVLGDKIWAKSKNLIVLLAGQCFANFIREKRKVFFGSCGVVLLHLVSLRIKLQNL